MISMFHRKIMENPLFQWPITKKNGGKPPCFIAKSTNPRTQWAILNRLLDVCQAGYSDKSGHGDFAEAWYRDLGQSDCDLGHQSLTAIATGELINHPKSLNMTNMSNLPLLSSSHD